MYWYVYTTRLIAVLLIFTAVMGSLYMACSHAIPLRVSL